MNETYFEQLLQWLARCPALTGIDLRVDDLPPAAGTGALFPKGVEQTDRWQNLLGQVTARQKMQLVLRLNLPFVPGDANLSAQTAACWNCRPGWRSRARPALPRSLATLTPYRRP